jgi:hypothetical protein
MSVSTDRRDTIDTPTPGAAVRSMVRNERRNCELGLCVMKPATVVRYDETTQTAQCVVGFLRVPAQGIDGLPGELGAPMPPELVSARVAVLQGSTHADHVPILPNDTGMLIFADRALDQWYRQSGVPVDPGHARTHDQADAVFIPGLAPDALRSMPRTPAQIAAQARVIEAPTIALGSAAVPGVDNVAIASLLHTYLTAAVTAAPVVALDGGASFKAGLLAYLGANPFTAYAASKVSAE